MSKKKEEKEKKETEPIQPHVDTVAAKPQIAKGSETSAGQMGMTAVCTYLVEPCVAKSTWFERGDANVT